MCLVELYLLVKGELRISGKEKRWRRGMEWGLSNIVIIRSGYVTLSRVKLD